MRWLIILYALCVVGCSGEPEAAEPPAPPAAVFEGLPLSGNKATALSAGFGACQEMTRGLRCSKGGVTIKGVGPFNAAVDLDQQGGRFDQVTLWHDSDQGAMLPLKGRLENDGWKSCLTAEEERFWKPPAPFRIAMDTSYWGKRRLVISAPPPDPKPYCPTS